MFNRVRNFIVFAIKVRFLNGSAVFINLSNSKVLHILTFTLVAVALC